MSELQKQVTVTELVQLEAERERFGAVIKVDIDRAIKESAATVLEVDCLASSAVAKSYLDTLRAFAKKAEENRLHFGRIVKRFKDGWDEWFRGLTNDLNVEVLRLTDLLKDYNKRLQEKEAAERAKRDAEIARREAIQQSHQEKGHKVDPVPREMLVPEVAPAKSQSAAPGRTVWTWDLVDEAQVPREFLQIDRGAVTAAVRSGVREIPGIKIYSKLSL